MSFGIFPPMLAFILSTSLTHTENTWHGAQQGPFKPCVQPYCSHYNRKHLFSLSCPSDNMHDSTPQGCSCGNRFRFFFLFCYGLSSTVVFLKGQACLKCPSAVNISSSELPVPTHTRFAEASSLSPYYRLPWQLSLLVRKWEERNKRKREMKTLLSTYVPEPVCVYVPQRHSACV